MSNDKKSGPKQVFSGNLSLPDLGLPTRRRGTSQGQGYSRNIRNNQNDESLPQTRGRSRAWLPQAAGGRLAL